MQFSVVFAGEARASLLKATLPSPLVCVRNRTELAAATSTRGAVAFVDVDLLSQIDGERATFPIIGIIDDTAADTPVATVRLLDRFPWLSHLVSASMLSTPVARPHLAMLLERLDLGVEQGVIGTTGIGRSARLAQASRREARFERIAEFFTKQGLSERSISALCEIAVELVMNALYVAPFEAGYFKTPIPRT
jgi:hypothetical protein